MFDGPLLVLFYAWPPNSQLLFSEPENATPFKDVDGPVGPRGCAQSKVELNKMFLEFDFVGGPFSKKYPNFDFWFSHTPPPTVVILG